MSVGCIVKKGAASAVCWTYYISVGSNIEHMGWYSQLEGQEFYDDLPVLLESFMLELSLKLERHLHD